MGVVVHKAIGEYVVHKAMQSGSHNCTNDGENFMVHLTWLCGFKRHFCLAHPEYLGGRCDGPGPFRG